jgi:hypothetical protein
VYFRKRRRGEVRYSLAPDDPGPPATKQQEGRPVKWGKEQRVDRPNAVTLLTLRLPTQMRLCQVAIMIYTRWPFLDRPSEPHPDRTHLKKRVMMRARGIIVILCATHHDAPVMYIRKTSHRTGTRARGKPIRWSSEGGEGRIGLTMCRLYSRGGLEHIPQKDWLCMPGYYFWGRTS